MNVNEKTKKRIRNVLFVFLAILEIYIFYMNFEKIKTFGKPIVMDNEWVFILLSFLLPGGVLLVINGKILVPALFAIMQFFYGIILRMIWIPKKDAEKVHKDCINWLMNLKVHWGKCKNSEQRAIFNTVEGLMAVCNCNNSLFRKFKEITNEAQWYLLKSLTDIGFEVEVTSTTMETAMAAYMCLISAEKCSVLKKKHIDQLIKVAEVFLDSASSYGWGSIYGVKCDDKDVQNFHSIWVYRFINQTCYADSYEFDSMFCSFVDRTTQGLLGYFSGDQSRVVITSLLVILLYEIKNSNLRAKLFEKVNLLKIQKFLVKSLYSKRMYTEIENTPGYDTYGYNESMPIPWCHNSLSYALTALSLIKQHTGIRFNYKLKIMWIMRKTLKNCIISDGDGSYYQDERIGDSYEGVHTFPTMYFVVGLSNFIRGMYNEYRNGHIDKALNSISKVLGIRPINDEAA